MPLTQQAKQTNWSFNTKKMLGNTFIESRNLQQRFKYIKN